MRERLGIIRPLLALTILTVACGKPYSEQLFTPPPTTSPTPSATLQPETNNSAARGERIYNQVLFDTQEFLTAYVKSPELQTCIMSVLEKQQFLQKIKEFPDKAEEDFVIRYGVKKRDGTPSCLMELYYKSNKLRAVNLEADIIGLRPDMLQSINEQDPKSIPNDKLTEIAEEFYNIPNAKWEDVNFGFSKTINPGKNTKENLDTGVYVEASIYAQGQSTLFVEIPEVGTKL